MRITALAACVSVCAAAAAQTPSAGPLQSDLKASFIRQVEQVAQKTDGVVGYAVTDLT